MRQGSEKYSAVQEPFKFGTKAETLFRLSSRLGQEHFCEQFIFSLGRWKDEADLLIEQCLDQLEADQFVVRSSARGEDTAHSSMAGAFHSVLGVAADSTALREGIEAVFLSYGDHGQGNDQVFVQPQVQNVAVAGVIVTRDLDTGAPYYVINYDDMTGRTDSVTGGSASKTVLVHRSRSDKLNSERLQKLVAVVQSIEAETGNDCLDIEFCITRSGALYILQVRPLATQRNWYAVSDTSVDGQIELTRAELAERMVAVDGILGDKTVFGQMPDWNPAEMIGSRPQPLSYSLYENQITSKAWAEARYRMGYRDMRGNALMANLAGQPFIDVRLSLNSFLPAGVDESVGAKLVNAQLDRLEDNRDLHDKIEFEIAFPNYDFRFDDRSGELRDAGLDRSEITSFKAQLLDLTVRQLQNWDASTRDIEARLSSLDDTVEAAASRPPIEAVRLLMDACVSNGTVPFAEAARHGFIGVSLLKSMVHMGALPEEESARFLVSIETVAHELIRDLGALHSGDMEEAEFLQRHGHLRPGTYDVTSYRYDERPQLYLSGAGAHADAPADFQLSETSRRDIDTLAAELGGFDAEALLKYVRGAVELRESAKFRFTRAISEILRAIGRAGEEIGHDREALSYLTIDQFLDGYSRPELINEQVEASREAYRVNRLVRLPHVIFSPVDVDVIRVPLGKPTFITEESITAPTAHLETNTVVPIEGRIVVIESADPGFDWIFSHNICGLITKFGGANSHMAIRCAEFLVPAAIGCGERLFDDLVHADMVALNCAAHKVEPF